MSTDDEKLLGDKNAMMDGKDIVVRTAALKQFLVCSLCNGYLRAATTVSECLHTFCEPCLHARFAANLITCPTCAGQLSVNPFESVRSDVAIQSVVERLLRPSLARQAAAAAPPPSSGEGAVADDASSRKRPHDDDSNDNDSAKRAKTTDTGKRAQRRRLAKARDDELGVVDGCPVTVAYTRVGAAATRRPVPPGVEVSPKGIVTVGGQAFMLVAISPAEPCDDAPAFAVRMQTKASHTLRTLAKFVRKRAGVSKRASIDFACNGELLGREFTLEFVVKTRWHTPNTPLALTYVVRQPQ